MARNKKSRPQTAPRGVSQVALDQSRKRQAKRLKETVVRTKMTSEVGVIKSGPHQPDIKPVPKQTEPAPESKKLFIGTCFIDSSLEQQKWLDLQLHWIHQTTNEYDHFTFLQNGSDAPFQEKNTKVIRATGVENAKQSAAHVAGLQILLDYAKRHRNFYDHFLFIDSDAFPIRKDWYELLKLRMVQPYEIAIAIRPENLEQRIHSSIVFAKKSALDHLLFQVGLIPTKDLMGESENDVTCQPYQTERRSFAYPLLRSNKFSIHPLLCGIYYDLFYHNGCGSGRGYNMRASEYWKHIAGHDPDLDQWVSDLMDHPMEFVGRLAGWSPNEYPKVQDGR